MLKYDVTMTLAGQVRTWTREPPYASVCGTDGEWITYEMFQGDPAILVEVCEKFCLLPAVRDVAKGLIGLIDYLASAKSLGMEFSKLCMKTDLLVIRTTSDYPYAEHNVMSNMVRILNQANFKGVSVFLPEGVDLHEVGEEAGRAVYRVLKKRYEP